MTARCAALLSVAWLAGCGPASAPPAAQSGGSSTQAAAAPRHLVLITIDTLRADRVGAYGHAAARTPVLDALAAGGARFTQAFATAPITLPSHASLLTGRYPPAHGARHNGIAVGATVPTLATTLAASGFRTAAFVSAFPLDRRFGLQRGFAEYDATLGRDGNGRVRNERPGAETVAHAREWLTGQLAAGARVFLWLHLFEPHAPYGDPGQAAGTPATTRYDDEVAAADRAAGQLLDALGAAAAATLVVATADHGEAFGEHGEIGHSVFVYDTTLRVPLIVRGPGIPPGGTIAQPVSLVDVAPTVLNALGVNAIASDGVDLAPLLHGGRLAPRTLYAESYAPQFDFGWSALRAVRDERWKFISAPRPELYDVSADGAELRNLFEQNRERATAFVATLDAIDAPASRSAAPAGAAASKTGGDPETERRLRSLGYLSGAGGRGHPAARPDPKDRVTLAARIAQVTSGELQGDALLAALEGILREDPQNPQAHLRLGYAELARGGCARAEPHFRAALAARLPSADPGLGLADCLSRRGDFAAAAAALDEARRLEPGNPVVDANLGVLALARRDAAAAITHLQAALAADPGMLEARFTLARALATAGRRGEALAEAERLLAALPPSAPQRSEVQRLIAALR